MSDFEFRLTPGPLHMLAAMTVRQAILRGTVGRRPWYLLHFPDDDVERVHARAAKTLWRLGLIDVDFESDNDEVVDFVVTQSGHRWMFENLILSAAKSGKLVEHVVTKWE